MNVNDVLLHYGIPGMKWGKRKGIGVVGRSIVKSTASVQQLRANMARRAAKGTKVDRDSIASQRKQMLSMKGPTGKPLFKNKDIDDMLDALDKNIEKYSKKADGLESLAKMLIQDVDANRR